MNCKYMNMLRVVRGNAFKLKIAVEAYTPSGRRIDSFALGEAVLKLDKNGTLTTKEYTILEGTTILVAFDGSESLGVYGFQMSGEYEGEAWRWANAEIFQIVESNVKAHIPEGCVLLDDTYNMALKIVLSGGDGITFTPSVSEQGIISWTNDGGLPNPEPRNIRGPRGEQGPQGEVGPQGPRGQMGLRGQIGPKGDKGDKGDTGATPVLDVTASVDENVGNPMVVVESFGPAEHRTFDFQFKNLKGQKGETGATGPQGPQGQQGEPGNYTKPASGIPLSDLNGNVASGIVYDVTANNSGATFASLSALLSSGSLSTLIPTSVRKGGMQIRFVCSSDNKYVQFRYMPSDAATVATFTNVANWQGVDAEPTADSKNFVESGGVVSLNNDTCQLFGEAVLENAKVDENLVSLSKVMTSVNVSETKQGYYNVETRKFVANSSVTMKVFDVTESKTYQVKCVTAGGVVVSNITLLQDDEVVYTQRLASEPVLNLFAIGFNKIALLTDNCFVNEYDSFSPRMDFIGAGKNLFNKDTVVNGKINSDGTVPDSDSHYTSDLIAIKPNTAYMFASDYLNVGVMQPGLVSSVLMYDSSKTPLTGSGAYISNYISGFTSISNAAFIRFSFPRSYLQSMMLCATDGMDYVYRGYEQKIDANSIGEIDGSGIKDLSMSVKKMECVDIIRGKNLFNKEDSLVIGGFIGNSGIVSASASYFTSGFISIDSTKSYVLSYNGTASPFRFALLYDENYIPLQNGYLQNQSSVSPIMGAAYIRFSTSPSYKEAIQFEEGTTATSYEAYQEKIIFKKSVLPNDVPEHSVKVSSFELISYQGVNYNIFDPETDVIEAAGTYINSSTGKAVYNPSLTDCYGYTDYIPIDVNGLYTNGIHIAGAVIGGAYYDKDKKYISGIRSYAIPYIEGASYIRFSLSSSANILVSIGTNERDYIAFDGRREIVSRNYLPDSEVKDFSDLFFLPKHIYVASGRTIEIYYNQIMLNADKYNIKATCSIGKALDRKFQIVGNNTHVGNTYTLSIKVYDDFSNIVAEGTSTIHIVSNTISSAKSVLPVGDSLTNGKAWLSELHNLSGNISTVGTRNEVHEGRSGATVSTYTDVSGGIVYNFDNYYKGVGYNTAPTFDITQSYSIGDKVKIAHTFDNGSSGYRYWVFTSAHAPGAFNESEAYCFSDGNPFYDYVNDKFSMNFYKSFQGINYDAIILFLGTNGINLTPETNLNGALGIKNLIELIREDEPTIPIVVVNTIFRSSQNGIGNQGNTDGYTAQSAYKFNEDKKVLLLGQAIDELCGSMSNVYLCPVGFTHDSKYNFGNTKIAVNPRLTDTDTVYELMPLDSVHPQNSGYMQIADEIFSTLCAVFNSL